MDPHSEEKGRLSNQFEGFEYAPKADMWDRIEAGQGQAEEREALKRKFALFAWQPNKAVWGRIAAELQPGNRVAAVYWWSIAAGLALLMGIGTYFSAFQGSESSTGRSFANKSKQFELQALPDVQQGKNQQDNSNIWVADQDGSRSQFKVRTHLSNNPPSHHKEERANISPEHRPGHASVEALAEKPASDFWDAEASWMLWLEQQRELDIELDYLQAVAQVEANDEENPIQPPKTWSAQLGGNASSGASSVSGPEANLSLDNGGTFTGLTPNSLESNKTIEEYSSPLVLGGFVNRSLSRRLDLGLGIVYTQMRSTIHLEGIGQSRDEAITRQYLGLAGQLNYAYLQRKRWQLYASTSLQADKGLSKTSEVKTSLNGVTSEAQTLKSKAGEQLSMSLGTGVNVFVLPKLALYAQGSMASYPLQTKPNLFSQKPFWPVAQFGLRLKL